MTLGPQDLRTLDGLMMLLRSPEPWFTAASRPLERLNGTLHDLIAVSGNWYDLPHKAGVLANEAHRRPTATVLLAGGRNERLTPPEAVRIGGEPMLLQKELRERFGIEAHRMVLWTGSRITNHNLRFALHYVSMIHGFDRFAQPVRLQLVEEGFLLRRVAAALRGILSNESPSGLSSIHFLPCGPRSFSGLVMWHIGAGLSMSHQSLPFARCALPEPSIPSSPHDANGPTPHAQVAAHGGHADLALALVLGEVERLISYAAPTSQLADNVRLPPPSINQSHPELVAAAATLRSRHHDMLAAGAAKLASPREVFESGAAPTSRNGHQRRLARSYSHG